jgi:hypothetical protein
MAVITAAIFKSVFTVTENRRSLAREKQPEESDDVLGVIPS